MSVLRTFVVFGVGILVGGVVGGYATTVVYGERPTAVEPKFPACPPCPACPVASPSIAEESPHPDSPDEVVVAPSGGPEEVDVGSEPARPGLPSQAVKIASSAFGREIQSCLTKEVEGTALFDLTVTATSGIGHLREVVLIKADPKLKALEPCFLEAAKRVQFGWSQGEGESKLRYPLMLTAPSP
ncbi:MAG: hypothetical protein U1E65_14715 [Myxococcota bacterium]